MVGFTLFFMVVWILSFEVSFIENQTNLTFVALPHSFFASDDAILRKVELSDLGPNILFFNVCLLKGTNAC